MDEEFVSTKRFFQSQNITLSDFWLESCIQWYREENPGLNYTLKTLHLKVYEQWLLLDLRDVELPILPANLSQQKKVILNGIYSLQVMHIVDISRSKFYQIQRIRNNNALINSMNDQENNNQTLNHGKRVLQLLLTDGVQEIEAIEYKPIQVLNCNLPPGTKIKIMGPVVVRRGQMMLDEKHVSVLGGEVEELLVSNAAENVLAKALSLPLNPSPNTIKEDLQLAPGNIENVIERNNVCNITTNNNQGRTLSNAISTNDNRVMPERNVNNMNKNNLRAECKEKNCDFITEDEEMRILEEVDLLLETEREIHTNNPNNIFEDHSIDADTALRLESPNGNKQQGNANNVDIKNVSSDSDKSIFEDMDIDAHLDQIDEQVKQMNNKPTKKEIEIGHLLSNNITSGKFTIRAKFKSVIQKLTVTDNAWSLKISITDGKNDMVVCVHSDVISDLMGYYPDAVMALKKDILNKDEDATVKVMKIIEGLKAKIMHLDCRMEVTFSSHQDYPTITSLK